MVQSFIALSAIAVAWLIYFFIHSALASLRVKDWVAQHWPRLHSRYRVTYNIVALLTLAPIVWLLHHYQGPSLWHWQGAWRWLNEAIALGAIGGFLWSLRYYDAREFLGLKTNDKPRLHISPLHRVVRHPWYSLALLLIWTRDMDAGLLISALIVTTYFLIGSRLEEKKLIAQYGKPYHRYQHLVPALVPLPWRILDRNTAAELENEAAADAASRKRR